LSSIVMIAVLAGALLHAIWNAIIRGASDKSLDTLLILSGAGLLTTFALPFVSVPAAASWPYLGASVLIHVAYFSVVAFTYRDSDLSFAYPVMRGSAPALSAVAVLFIVHESPSFTGWAGILIVSSGIVLLASDSWLAGALKARTLMLPLASAAITVTYTLVDGMGARLSEHPLSYTGWMVLLTAIPFLVWSCIRRGRNVATHMRSRWSLGLVGGACTLVSYSLALWAMAHTSIALVASLRETSVAFGAFIAIVFLGERVGLVRCLSIVLVLIGAIAIGMS
jgi:drug/metabolite transporter (DMT)-like permease